MSLLAAFWCKFTKAYLYKVVFIALCLIFTCVNLQASRNAVNSESDSLRISLLTCSPGDEIYSAYGHSAVRVVDLKLGYDLVFNYGTFDFGTPYFIPKFLCGTLDYMLSVSSYQRFVRAYEREQRDVVESELILSTYEKVDLERFLFRNMQPENRFYRYDFFFDNCATRIRDLVFRISKRDVSAFQKADEDETFRDCLHLYVGSERWYGQGIDLILGTRADRDISGYEKAMLPDFLEQLLRRDGLLGEREQVLSCRREENDDMPVSPNVFSWGFVIAILISSLIEWKRNKWFKWVDYLLFAVSSILSLLFWFLWLISEIKITSYNLNVLWASVLYIPMIVCLIRHKDMATRRLAKLNIILIAAFFAEAVCGIQYAPPIAIASAVCLMARNILIVMRFNRSHEIKSMA